MRDAIVRTVGVVIFAEGNMRWLGWLSLVEAVMTVVLTIAFTRRLGLAGAALGPLVATTLVISPYSFWRVAQIIGMPASALLWRGAGRAFLRTIPAFGALLIVAECLPKSLGWLWILIVGLAAVAANIAMFDLPILLRTQRQEWSQRFHALFEAH